MFTMMIGIRTGRRAAMDSFKSVWVWVGERNGSKWCRLTCFTAITAFPSVTGVLVGCASPSIHPSPACQTSGLMELVSLTGGVFLILQLASGFTFFFCFWCWLLGWCSASDCVSPPHWAFPGNGKPRWPFLGSVSPPLSLSLSLTLYVLCFATCFLCGPDHHWEKHMAVSAEVQVWKRKPSAELDTRGSIK